jgi:uncharacterized protein YecT (DUF1311 family)
MRLTFKAGIFMLACLPPLAQANEMPRLPDAKSMREECSAFPQTEMRQCLLKQVDDSQRVLEQAKNLAHKRISGWDEDQRYIRQAAAALETSDRSYLQYREQQCAWQSALSGGAAGNAKDIRLLACIAELNYRQAAVLKNAVAELPEK